MTIEELHAECERQRSLAIEAAARATMHFKQKEALLLEMQAVSEYLKPNWSNDLPWPDEIIIAIDQRVLTAQMDAGHDAMQAHMMKTVLEGYEAWEAALIEADGAWTEDGAIILPDAMYQTLMDLQKARNEALGR